MAETKKKKKVEDHEENIKSVKGKENRENSSARKSDRHKIYLRTGHHIKQRKTERDS